MKALIQRISSVALNLPDKLQIIADDQREFPVLNRFNFQIPPIGKATIRIHNEEIEIHASIVDSALIPFGLTVGGLLLPDGVFEITMVSTKGPS